LLINEILDLSKIESGTATLDLAAVTFTTLRDQTALFLHRVLSALPADKHILLQRLQDASTLAGKTVLIVDDDVRNIFALTAALERQGMTVLSAEGGRVTD
jgi:signal transduction histidine kinase